MSTKMFVVKVGFRNGLCDAVSSGEDDPLVTYLKDEITHTVMQ
jgi:hypothetical protein